MNLPKPILNGIRKGNLSAVGEVQGIGWKTKTVSKFIVTSFKEE